MSVCKFSYYRSTTIAVAFGVMEVSMKRWRYASWEHSHVYETLLRITGRVFAFLLVSASRCDLTRASEVAATKNRRIEDWSLDIKVQKEDTPGELRIRKFQRTFEARRDPVWTRKKQRRLSTKSMLTLHSHGWYNFRSNPKSPTWALQWMQKITDRRELEGDRHINLKQVYVDTS